MHWLLLLEFTVLSLFMQSPIYTSDFAKMLIIFKDLVPSGCHYQVPSYHNFTYSTAPVKHITGHNKFTGRMRVSQFAWELLKTTQCKPAQIGL